MSHLSESNKHYSTGFLGIQQPVHKAGAKPTAPPTEIKYNTDPPPRTLHWVEALATLLSLEHRQGTDASGYRTRPWRESMRQEDLVEPVQNAVIHKQSNDEARGMLASMTKK